MIKLNLKTAWRNLLRNKGYSVINIGGLAIGIAVTMFIGLWIHDEMSFNKYHKNYNDIAQVWHGYTSTETSKIEGGYSLQYPVGKTLKNNYAQYFKHILMSWGVTDYNISLGNNKFSKTGLFIEGGAIDMFSLKMLKGTSKSLDAPNSIILSKSFARTLFKEEDPINKRLKIDGQMDVQVTGVFDDMPKNSKFGEVQFLSPWSLFIANKEWLRNNENDWDNTAASVYVQIQPNTRMEEVNVRIKDLYYKNVPADFFKTIEKSKPFAQIIPMNTWHLYSEFVDGKPAKGRISFVRLFGIIGIFVLLLACINFINLSTARSEKRAKEVGVRKAIGSGRGQLISQFLSESYLVVFLAFVVSMVLLILFNNWFSNLADKEIMLPFSNPLFWIVAMLGIGIVGFIAGIYPAFYLSSFRPVGVLKRIARAGRFASLPRKTLVVVQFSVSVILIIGTLIVYRQIQFARNRPVGYDRNSLIAVQLNNAEFKGKESLLKNELRNTGVVYETAMSSSPVTAVWNITNGYKWDKKDARMDAEFAICNITTEFGKTVGWKLVAGRDYSKDFPTDTAESIIINEAAVKYMGLRDPVGKDLTDVNEFGVPKWTKKIIGVVKDVIMESPYEPVKQTLYYYNKNASSVLHIKMNPSVSAGAALPKIKAVFDKIAPSALFDYKFVDTEYALKFSQEVRIGKLSGVFAILAIFISCLGLFGLASFVAEQRIKEIGIRKVVGASVFNIWKLLSRDFVMLVMISCAVAIPVAYYYMQEWLSKYQYRTEMSWYIFGMAMGGALLITILTVSFQAIKAALANPIKSLRTE